MNILVTGGAGFIGSNLVRALLKQGHNVRVLDNFSTGFRKNLEDLGENLEIIEGDITNSEDCAKACVGIDAVSHQAAFGSVPRSIEFPELYSMNNLHGFVTVCNQARLAGVKRIVYASSSSVYGDLLVSPKKETQRGRPLSPYAASKQSKEDFAHAFANAYGMTMVGFRYFNVFGPRQNPKGPYAAVIPLFVNHILNDESSVIFGDGEQSRDFTFVKNVVFANISAMTSELKQDSYIFNIACGQSTSVNRLYKIIADSLNSSIKPEYKPPRNGDIKDSLADITQAKELLNYNEAISLEDGLVETIEWYKNNRNYFIEVK